MQPEFEVLPPQRPTPPPTPKKPKGIFGWLIGLGLVYKFGAALLIFFKTGGTMLLSIGAYSLLFGWKFATGLVLLIFVHEMGHVISAWCYRIPVSAPMFIPMLGAYVMLKNRPTDSFSNAIISYAGPLAAGLGGWVCLYLGQLTAQHWLLAVALYTFFLNLFNLAPITPLDGSHIWICFSRRRTPDVILTDRLYLGIFLAALVGGLILGCMHSWGNLPPPSSIGR